MEEIKTYLWFIFFVGVTSGFILLSIYLKKTNLSGINVINIIIAISSLIAVIIFGISVEKFNNRQQEIFTREDNLRKLQANSLAFEILDNLARTVETHQKLTNISSNKYSKILSVELWDKFDIYSANYLFEETMDKKYLGDVIYGITNLYNLFRKYNYYMERASHIEILSNKSDYQTTLMNHLLIMEDIFKEMSCQIHNKYWEKYKQRTDNMAETINYINKYKPEQCPLERKD